MNYKILAASAVVTGGMLAVWLSQTGTGDVEPTLLERVTTLDMEESTAPAYSVSPRAAAPALMEPTGLSEFAEAEGIAELETPNSPNSPPNTSAGPKIAYRFGYGFRIPADALKPLQDRHADLCESRGPNVCRIISMEQADNESGVTAGTLHLAVASPLARSFGKDLTRTAESAEGELISSSIDGEDLSKQMVDTEARLRARIVLRDRLMDVLKNRRGTVAELVEAERGVARVNEEIDQARSWLAEMRGRVDFSQIHIDYASGVIQRGGFAEPVGEAFASAGETLGGMLAGLIRLLTVLLPLILLCWLLVLGWRWMGRPGKGLLRPMPEAEPA